MLEWQLYGRQLIHSEYFLIDILEEYYNNGTSLKADSRYILLETHFYTTLSS